MNIGFLKVPVGSQTSLQRNSIFTIVFLLVTMILTAFVIVPRTNELLESQNNKDIAVELASEAKLFTNFVDSQKSILSDLALYPSIVNSAMLSDGSNPDVVEQFDNVTIGGNPGRLVLQDIAGTVLIQSTRELQGSYVSGGAWVEQLLNDEISYLFKLLGQEGDHFTFQVSVPVIYKDSVEGILSAEITVLLNQVFVAQSFDHVAFRLQQGQMTVNTTSDHIQIPREDYLELADAGLTFVYITDDSVIKNKERSLRNTILVVLLIGLGVTFLLLALFGLHGLNKGGKVKPGNSINISAYGLPAVVSVIGFAATITAFLIIQNYQRSSNEAIELSTGKARVQVIRENIRRNIEVLNSVKAFFAASDFVDRSEFSIYTKPLLRNHPNIEALQWIPNVARSERNDFEARAKADGLADFGIREINTDGDMVVASARDRFFPIYYVEPSEGNEKTIGLDLLTDTKRIVALTKASRTGTMVATAPAALVEGGESESELLIFLPVYHKAITSESDGLSSLNRVNGFVLLSLRLGELIGDSLSIENQRQSIHILDVTEPDNLENVFGVSARTDSYSFSESIEVAGRNWRIDTRVQKNNNPISWAAWLVLLGGLVFTALPTMGIVYLIRRREILETLVERTAELRLLSSIAANSNDAFMITDAGEPDPKVGRRKVVYVNDAFSRLTGYSYEEALGDTPHLLHGESTDQEMFQELLDSIAQGKSFRGDFTNHNKINEPYCVDMNVIPLRNEYGEVTHFGAVLQDITKRKTAEQEREKLIEKLTDSNEELARFAFVCSHDLQEPLRMIGSFTEKLQAHVADDLVNDEKGKKYLGFIVDGAHRAQALVSEILTYASVENNTQKQERVNSIELIDSIKATLRTALDSVNGKITFDTLPDVQGNKTQIYQLFLNLINNGLKYQKAGAVPHVHVSATDAGEYWQYAIKDNGIGMEERHLHKIFDVFQRLHRRTQYVGTGIGLSICKKVVERHGGTLWVESEHGVGSTFYFTLLKPIVREVIDERERKAS